MAGIAEYLDACEYRRSFLQQQLNALQEERQMFDGDSERLSGVAQRVRQELIGYLLPEVSDQHLKSLEQRLSYSGLMSIKEKYNELFQAAERRRAEIEKMDEFLHYDFLIDQAKRNVEDVRPTYESFRQKIALWEKSRWFQQLLKRNYFDLSYTAGWWRRFWDWRAVSHLMSHLKRKGGLLFETPTELKQHYRHLRAEADDVIAAYDRRVGEHDRIEAIKSEHQQLLGAPEHLLSALFQNLGNAIIDHLDACPEEVRIDLARGDKVLNTFLRKQTGLQKQIQYLRELPVTRVDSVVQQLNQEIQSLDAKIKKLKAQQARRKRKYFSEDDIERMRNVKVDKWARRREKNARLRQRIVTFNQYDQGSFVRDYLWWDLITDGALGDDIYEVRDFRTHHPEWDRSRYRDPTSDTYAMGAAIMYDDAANDLAASMTSGSNDDSLSDHS